jgi:hypothetical protein
VGVALIASLFVSACESSPGGSVLVPADQAAARLAPRYCDRSEQCDAAKFKASFASKSDCVDAVTKESRESEKKDEAITEATLQECEKRVDSTPCASLDQSLVCPR